MKEENRNIEKGLYFVHGFYLEYEENGEINYENIVRNHILLYKCTLEDIYNLEEFEININDPRIQGNIEEGHYVFYDGETIQNADEHPTARLYREINTLVLEQLRRTNADSLPEKGYDRISDVISYHVNVGHANCSLIVFYSDNKCHVWMVDCAIRGCRGYCNYHNNLDSCLDEIKKNNRVNKIEKLLITHMHYDHINGVEYVIKNGWIDGNTEVWLNLNYQHYSPTSDNMLLHLNGLGVKIIDPVIKNSTNNIEILYPEISYDNKHNRPPKGNINNASVMYKINLGRESMLFPGDIETEGWDSITWCKSWMGRPTYYCISHHGSKTGHFRNGCANKRISKKVNNIADCIDYITKKQILMGKDGTFAGIYDNDVLKDFSNIEKTEGYKYIKLIWGSGHIDRI